MVVGGGVRSWSPPPRPLPVQIRLRAPNWSTISFSSSISILFSSLLAKDRIFLKACSIMVVFYFFDNSSSSSFLFFPILGIHSIKFGFHSIKFGFHSIKFQTAKVIYNIGVKPRYTVDSHLFELAVIRSSRLFIYLFIQTQK